MANSVDCLIAGNGALASAAAFELQRRAPGLKIAIVGPAQRPGSASNAAGAMLNVFAELDAGTLDHAIHRHKFELARQATKRWPGWVDALNAASKGAADLKIGLGTYVIKNMAGDEQDDAAYAAILSALQTYQEPHDIVSPAAISGFSPSSEQRALQAIHIPGEGLINPRRLLAAYEAAFAASPAITQIDARVTDVLQSGDKLTGVRLSDGSEIRAAKVLLANGADAGQTLNSIPDLKARVLPLFYGIGAALQLKIRGAAPSSVVRTPNRALACGIHMVPQSANQVYIGASNQVSPWPEFSPRLTSVHFLIDAAMRQLNSTFYNAELERTFLGYRPTSADTLPMIGETSLPGLFMLTGTKRDGLHNSPVYAQDIVDRILGGPGVVDRALLPERKVIRWLSKDDGLRLGVMHLRSAGVQHGLTMPRSNWEPMVTDMLHRHVEEVYTKTGVDYGIPPELLDIYRFGHVTSDH